MITEERSKFEAFSQQMLDQFWLWVAIWAVFSPFYAINIPDLALMIQQLGWKLPEFDFEFDLQLKSELGFPIRDLGLPSLLAFILHLIPGIWLLILISRFAMAFFHGFNGKEKSIFLRWGLKGSGFLISLLVIGFADFLLGQHYSMLITSLGLTSCEFLLLNGGILVLFGVISR